MTATGTATGTGPGGGTSARAVRAAGRSGFVARGVVYALVGVLALRIAFGTGGEDADRQGALHQVALRPFGAVLLWVLAAGFLGMALWRAWTAVFGEAGERKTGSRVLSAGRAVFYASVAWGTAAYAAGSGGGSDSDAASRDWTATVLGWPGGRWLVGAAGLALAGVGVAIGVRALQRRFLRKLDTSGMRPRTRTAVTGTGVSGNLARGVLYAAAGAFAAVAAVRFDPGRAKGMDDTLRALATSPAGPWLLAVVAAGLVLYGVFSFLSARWRRF
ncbi:MULTISPECIES: DUF1206 domain-containing protein [Kitasatospora]|uniref:DUF1206 domain-containing protein n=1 Tax=Kitasatospora setae (strain ATCC 33774 / DSM 43861 / JCM 3304 / KCC A-0304 / NBRC 14216 / KM-6054) TaxID=452652 RepID=E4N591_KITSK|nr:DUF1206 domain-containing protein [Kitasatospora setae]BAJ26372.1 hypothetical protein KSE_05260 [Kitasatospora setae KM-6054]